MVVVRDPLALATLVLVIGVTLSTANAQAIVYVDDDASLGGDGANWVTAYKHLQDALAAADGGNEIHVAAGTYTPDRDEAGNVTHRDREATFQLINGVAVKGGFRGCPGGECGCGDPNERDIALYETILSGDLAGNDVEVASPDELHAEPTRGENSYHVITGSGTNDTAVLDGLEITAGNASGLYPSLQRFGGGMNNESGTQADLEVLKPMVDQAARDFCDAHEFVGPSADSACRMTLVEPNRKARELLESDPNFRDEPLREWAEAIGCSPSQVSGLPVWKAVMEESGRGKNQKAANTSKAVSVVGLTDKVSAGAGHDDDPSKTLEIDETMQRLIAEARAPELKNVLENLTSEQRRELVETLDNQAADAEPSPLDDNPVRQVKTGDPAQPVKTVPMQQVRTHKQL